MIHSIATIIHYCTNDYRFLRKSIEEVKLFSKKIIIPVCDHFFNGTPENRALLEKSYEEFPECLFIEFKYDPVEIYHPYQSAEKETQHWSRFWHSASRYIGALFVPAEIEYVLFLDADEIMDGKRFLHWLDLEIYRNWNSMRLQAYVYIQKASLRTCVIRPYPLFTKLPPTELLALLNVYERYGYFHYSAPFPKNGEVVDEKGIPFVHHYTWVRTKEECLCKASSWGHRFDKDWELSIDKLFDGSSRDPLDLNVEFEEVDIFFDPLSVGISEGIATNRSFVNVLKVDHATIRRKEIEKLL